LLKPREIPPHVFQVLAGDPGDGDVVDVDLLLADQVEQQVERPLVGLELNVVGRFHG